MMCSGFQDAREKGGCVANHCYNFELHYLAKKNIKASLPFELKIDTNLASIRNSVFETDFSRIALST